MRFPHLLLIEDNLDLTDLLRTELQDVGYQVSSASSLAQGMAHAHEGLPDLVITDLGLPDGDGEILVTRLREKSTIPIIVLSARDDVHEKVRLLDLGANDYVLKPFSFPELLARIAVQLRGTLTLVLTAGPLEVRLDRHQALLDGQDLQLSQMELALLTLLMRRPGQIFSRAEIVRELWKDQLPQQSNAIDFHFGNLRGKLRQHTPHLFVRNIRGIGYALSLLP